MTTFSRLVLGTVQLGLPYGIANTSGRPDHEHALAIVRAAVENGVLEFDTAQGYGDSERVLGRCFQQLDCAARVRVISKPDTKLDLHSPTAVRSAVNLSLERLRIPALEGMLLHREEFLDDWGHGVGQLFADLVKDGLLRRVGVSVYSPQAALRALQTEGIDMVQIPGNIFDRRFERAGVYTLAERLGKKLYVRSVFLQGLVFHTPTTLPEHMAFAGDSVRRFNALVAKWELTPQQLSLGYIRAAAPDAKVLFGAETDAQVLDNLASWSTTLSDECFQDIQATFDTVQERVLNPALWSE